MKQQEELVGSAVRVLQKFGVFWTWRLNRYEAICVIQKLYRTQIENIRLWKMQEAVRLEQLRAAAADKLLGAVEVKSRNFVANKLREKRRALAFRKKRLLAALLIQARAGHDPRRDSKTFDGGGVEAPAGHGPSEGRCR